MFANMKLRQKLMLGASFLAIVPIAIASLALGWTAITDSGKAMAERSEAQLVSLREVKKSQIQDYLETIGNQIKTLSNDRMIMDFARELPEAFNSFPSELRGGSETERLRSSLGSYYSQEFTPEFNRLNRGTSSPASDWLRRLNATGVALQHQYIEANPNPQGSKNDLSNPNDGTRYSSLHAKYHPHINDFLQKFGFYDLFIVEPDNGYVVYSVYKELDFATSLRSGSFAGSGLAKAYQQVVNSSFADAVALVDFEPYAASYNGAAGFIASPIMDGGELLGVLVFQMPIDKINAVMTNNNRWSDAGLGASGETYLVGSDKLLRSESRFLIEDKTGYMEALADGGTSRDVMERIAAKETAIGIASINTSSVVNALNGRSGFQIVPDYRNVPVLSAYAPVEVLGLRWALLAEIDEAEAYEVNEKLAEDIVGAALGIGVVIAVLAALIGVVFANSITRPIVASVGIAQQIAKGDLTADIQVKGSDEIGQLQQSLRDMKEKLYDIVSSAMDSANTVNAAAEQIVKGNMDLSQRTEEQASSLEETASSMEEMASTVTQNADNAKKANDLVSTARNQAMAGGEIVSKAVEAMGEINESSVKIANIVGVIDGIAFQTNLLALNAAVEAARAGDQGRGFAVVAAEVRTLAQRSAESAKEIKALIADSVEKVNQGSVLVNQSGESLNEIVEGVKNVAQIVSEIAAASAEQAMGAEQVNKAVTQMDQMTQQNAALVEEAAAAAQAMSEQTGHLTQQMSFFNLGQRSHSQQSREFTQNLERIQKEATARQAQNSALKHRPKAGVSGRKPVRQGQEPIRKNTAGDAHDEEWSQF